MARFSDEVLSDVHRITGRRRWTDVPLQILRGEAYRYTSALRCAQHAPTEARVPTKLALRHLRRSMGLNMPFTLEVGQGLFIGHGSRPGGSAAYVTRQA